MFGKAGGKLKVSFETRHEDGKGRVIVIERTRKYKLWRKYDEWRVAYCNKYRNRRLLVGFREGRINPFVLTVAIILRIQEVINGSDSKSN